MLPVRLPTTPRHMYCRRWNRGGAMRSCFPGN